MNGRGHKRVHLRYGETSLECLCLRDGTLDVKPIDHRTAINEYEREVIAILRRLGQASAAEIAGLSSRTKQAIATRMWHLRQTGLVCRVSRGLYEATDVSVAESGDR